MTHCTDSPLLSDPANFRSKTMQCMTTVSCIFTNRKWLKWLFTWSRKWKCKKLDNGRITWEIGLLIHVGFVLRKGVMKQKLQGLLTPNPLWGSPKNSMALDSDSFSNSVPDQIVSNHYCIVDFDQLGAITTYRKPFSQSPLQDECFRWGYPYWWYRVIISKVVHMLYKLQKEGIRNTTKRPQHNII